MFTDVTASAHEANFRGEPAGELNADDGRSNRPLRRSTSCSKLGENSK